MKTDDELAEICTEIYRQMYKEAEPSVDFDGLVGRDESNPDSYLNYYLNNDRQDEIIEEICKKHQLGEWDRDSINFAVHLGYAPNTSYERWNEVKDK